MTARLVTGPEADSNARREISGQVPQPDVLWRSQASVALSHQEGIHRLTLDGQWGAKVFAQQHTEDLQPAITARVLDGCVEITSDVADCITAAEVQRARRVCALEI